MGLFSRKNPKRSAPGPASEEVYIGRRLSSSLNVDECLTNYLSAAQQCYPVVGGLVDADWDVPPGVGEGAASSQGGGTSVPPARFVALSLGNGGRLHLAIWDGYIGYGRDGTGGQAREMWFVPPGFDGSPIPLPGVWKRLDGSLSSIGLVELAFWGGDA